MYGDAIWETSNANQKGSKDDKKEILDSDGEKYNGGCSWNNDYSYFPRRVSPFFLRGGYFSYSGGAGVFCFDYGNGGSSDSYGFRVVAL